jgi:hypothetical protein
MKIIPAAVPDFILKAHETRASLADNGEKNAV